VASIGMLCRCMAIVAFGAIALPLSWDRSGLLFLGLVGGTEGISSYNELLELNAAGGLSGAEREELQRSRRQAECFMLRKAQGGGNVNGRDRNYASKLLYDGTTTITGVKGTFNAGTSHLVNTVTPAPLVAGTPNKRAPFVSKDIWLIMSDAAKMGNYACWIEGMVTKTNVIAQPRVNSIQHHKSMFPPLHQSKIFLASVSLCVPSSATVLLSVIWLTVISQWVSPTLPFASLLVCLLIGIIIGLIKSFVVGTLTSLVKPFWRWPLLLGSTIVLTVFEGFLYYGLLTLPSPHFG
jgi:hypothetical protein